jgi:hypothetical protein
MVPGRGKQRPGWQRGLNLSGVSTMSKNHDQKKESKKEPALSPKEKKQAKKLKKEQRKVG